MIKRIKFNEELLCFIEKLQNEQTEKNTEALLIYERFLCYGTKYDFCRFYRDEDNCLINEMYNSCVLYGGADFDELADFFSFSEFNEVFCSYEAGRELSARLPHFRRNDVNLMIFKGIGVPCETQKDVSVSDFMKILSTGFDLDPELCYLETSHRVRHNISKLRQLGNSVLAIQHDLCGSALISHIATSPESRGKGDATRLILSVCAELSSNKVYLLCEDKMIDFYRRIGFETVCRKCELKNNLDL